MTVLLFFFFINVEAFLGGFDAFRNICVSRPKFRWSVKNWSTEVELYVFINVTPRFWGGGKMGGVGKRICNDIFISEYD